MFNTVGAKTSCPVVQPEKVICSSRDSMFGKIFQILPALFLQEVPIALRGSREFLEVA